MNVTISIDDHVVERARAIAQSHNTSLQELVRRYLETLVGAQSSEVVAQELISMMKTLGGHSGGATFRRDDAYEGRL
jgi:hypothetical protein